MIGQWTRLLTVTLLVGLVTSCAANKSGREISAPGAAEVQDIRIAEGSEKTVIEIEGEEPMIYTTFRLTDPDRLVIDLAGVGLSGFTGEIVMNHGPVRAMRPALGNSGSVSRLEFELNGSVETDVRTEGVNLVLEVTQSDAKKASFVFFPEGPVQVQAPEVEVAQVIAQDNKIDESPFEEGSDVESLVEVAKLEDVAPLETVETAEEVEIVADGGTDVVIPLVDSGLEVSVPGEMISVSDESGSEEVSFSDDTMMVSESDGPVPTPEMAASLESLNAPSSDSTAMMSEESSLNKTAITEKPEDNMMANVEPETVPAFEIEVLEPATKVSSVHFDQGEHLALVVRSNGVLAPRSFFLGSGDNRRLVIDLPGITSLKGKNRVAADDVRVKRVRMGQHKDKLRLVVDLSSVVNYAIDQSGGNLTVRFAGPEETLPEIIVAKKETIKEPLSKKEDSESLEKSEASESVVPEEGLIALGKPIDGPTSDTLAAHSEALATMVDAVALDAEPAEPLEQDKFESGFEVAQVEGETFLPEETGDMAAAEPEPEMDLDAPLLDAPMIEPTEVGDVSDMDLQPTSDSELSTSMESDADALPLPLPAPMIEMAEPDAPVEMMPGLSEGESLSSDLSPMLAEPLVSEPGMDDPMSPPSEAQAANDDPLKNEAMAEMHSDGESTSSDPLLSEQNGTAPAEDKSPPHKAEIVLSPPISTTVDSEAESTVLMPGTGEVSPAINEDMPKKEEQAEAKKKVILRRQRREQVRSRRESVALALAEAEAEAAALLPAGKFTGRKISLDFQDAQVTNVIRLIADVSGLNFVMGDDVKGRVTIKMHDVPWDQALDIILEIRSLGMVRQGDIIRIATLSNLNKQRNQKAEARASKIKAEELFTRVIYVNYGKATQMKGLVTKLLSSRGEITVATRVNAIVVKDIEGTLNDIETMVNKLDTKTPQVLIEARIVEVQPNFKRSLGVQWGADFKTSSGGNLFGLGNSASGSNAPVFAQSPDFSVNLPAANNLGGIGFSFGRFSDSPFQLDLRISAGESQEMTRLVSTPKIMVLDNREAVIKQGRRIPFASQSANGGTNVQLIDASLQLKVTPHISTDGGILLDVDLTKNEPGPPIAGSPNPTIFDKEVTTNVLLMDGETMVIGGIFETKTTESVSGIPWLRDIPGLGWLFKNEEKTASTTELLIFITPTVMQ